MPDSYDDPPVPPASRLAPPWPPDDAEVAEAVRRAIAERSWGQYRGPNVPRLAEALAEFFGLSYAYTCCSGTFAVELALRSVGVGPGDEVLMAGYDYPGNFRSIEAISARPVLVDVHPLNWNLDPALLAAAVGEHTRAVLVSHLHGGLVPMSAVLEIAMRHGLAVVEDICQAPGAVVGGRQAGTWGDVAVLSFGGSKLLTAGRGGAIVTRRADVYQRAKVFCEQGNHAFPLSELQAAALLPQVAKLAARNERRSLAVRHLLDRLGKSSVLKPLENTSNACLPVHYKLGFRFEPAGGQSRADFIAVAQSEGIGIDAGFRGFLLRSGKRCRVPGELVECRRAAESALVLHHPVLLEPLDVIDGVAAALLRAALVRRPFPAQTRQ